MPLRRRPSPFAALLAGGLCALHGCGPAAREPTLTPAQEERLRWPLPAPAAPRELWAGPETRVAGEEIRAQIRVLALQEEGAPFPVGLLLLRPEGRPLAGVVVAHGHFGGGRNDESAWLIAVELARRGALVAVVDSPGVEEWDEEGLDLHFARGAHNRVWLAAQGSHALALQVAGLRTALHLLRAEGAVPLGATGASGGAVTSFYLALQEPEIAALALAAPPPLPREAEAAGCPCDQVPGLPGPDPALLARLRTPTLWMADAPGPPPEGLPRSVRFRSLPGAHAYTAEMREEALAFFARQLGLLAGEPRPPPPPLDLRGPGRQPGWARVRDLPLRAPLASWRPAPPAGGAPPYELRCQGEPTALLLLGAEEGELEALAREGIAACALGLPEDPQAIGRALIAGRPPADDVLAAALAAADRRRPRAVLARRGWALIARHLGRPYAVIEPLRSLDALEPARDPAWVHVPGAWTSEAAAAVEAARRVGEDPVALGRALLASLEGP